VNSSRRILRCTNSLFSSHWGSWFLIFLVKKNGVSRLFFPSPPSSASSPFASDIYFFSCLPTLVLLCFGLIPDIRRHFRGTLRFLLGGSKMFSVLVPFSPGLPPLFAPQTSSRRARLLFLPVLGVLDSSIHLRGIKVSTPLAPVTPCEKSGLSSRFADLYIPAGSFDSDVFFFSPSLPPPTCPFSLLDPGEFAPCQTPKEPPRDLALSPPFYPVKYWTCQLKWLLLILHPAPPSCFCSHRSSHLPQF